MAITKVKGHTRKDGTKVKGHKRIVNRRQSSDPKKRSLHLSEMRKIGKQLRTDKSLSESQKHKLRRQHTFHAVKSGTVTLI